MNVEMQRPGLWKRVAAGILDFILLCTLAVGGAYALSAVLDYDGYSETVAAAKAAYEQEHHISFDVTAEEYNAMTEAEQAAYDEALAEANATLAENEELVHAYTMMQHLMLIIATGGILIAVLLLEFVVPLLLKNGSTVGKKVFGLGLVRSDSVRVNTMQLFTRTLIGKFTIEIMVPVYLVILILFNGIGMFGTVALGAILLLQVILYFATKNNCLLHDLMAGTVVVDITSQRIFASTEEQIEYAKRRAAEQAEQQDY